MAMCRMESLVVCGSVLLLLLVGPGAASSAGSRSLRRNGAIASKPDRGEAGTETIHAQWDKMDDFLKAMFTIGCDWKNSKDIHKYSAHCLEKGTCTTEEFEVELGRTQDKEVVALKEACGMIVAKQEGPCRSGCATRWNSMMEERDSCDKKCVTRYDKFERLCHSKVNDLKDIYVLTAKLIAAKKQCYNERCPKFPTVWVMSGEKEMKKEVDGRCEKYCKEDKIEMRCTKQYQLELDFALAAVKAECSEDNEAAECYRKKKGSVTEQFEGCSSKAKKTCEDAVEKCNDSKGSNEREGTAFCAKRKKMCDEQASKKCMAVHDAGVDKAKKECEAKAETKEKECMDKALKEKEKDAMKKCNKDKTKSCPDDCQEGCKVDKMNTCLDNLKQPSGMRDFCGDFWMLIEESTKIDPLTGDPAMPELESQ